MCTLTGMPIRKSAINPSRVVNDRHYDAETETFETKNTTLPITKGPDTHTLNVSQHYLVNVKY